MKKIIALCLALAMSASVLCACSGNSDSKTSDVSSQTESSDSENSAQSNTTATISEDSFENVNMINLYIPDGFDSDTGMSLMDARGYCAFSRNLEAIQSILTLTTSLGIKLTVVIWRTFLRLQLIASKMHSERFTMIIQRNRNILLIQKQPNQSMICHS